MADHNTERTVTDYRSRCEICDELIDDDEVIGVNSDAGLMAHDYHSSRALREARTAAGADPQTGRAIEIRSSLRADFENEAAAR